MSEYANKKMQEFTVEKHELLGQKTQKQRKIDDLAEKYAELDKESPKAVKDKLKKDMADLQNDVVNIDEKIKQIEAKIKNPEKLRMTIEKFSNSLNSLINRLEKGDLVEKDILVRNMVSNLEIDAQKRVIYRYKSPFNFIFEPEFSTGSPVGEPEVIILEHPLSVAKWLIYAPTSNPLLCANLSLQQRSKQIEPINYTP
ncbi:hypothetical protein IJF93_00010 [Candidatus Saccharibacteria bacterium]|nr:hypothetical protein [Candidatus Saccharibacteria bacterium]